MTAQGTENSPPVSRLRGKASPSLFKQINSHKCQINLCSGAATSNEEREPPRRRRRGAGLERQMGGGGRFGDARSAPLSRGALGRQKGCPVVAPWVAAPPPAWLLCSSSSQACTCGVNPIISLRSGRFANHQHSPCQSTARLGGVAHTPRLLLLLHEDIMPIPILM